MHMVYKVIHHISHDKIDTTRKEKKEEIPKEVFVFLL